MMRKKLIFLTFFICFLSFGQKQTVLKGVVIDKVTKEALPFTNIVYPKKALGTITNSNGNYNLLLNNAQEKDSIIISYLGYKTKNFTVGNLLSKTTIELNPDVNQLNEVVVTETLPKINVKAFMKEVITNYNKNRRKTPHIAIAHYREKAMLKEKYIMFMESIGYSLFSGKKTGASVLSNYKFFCEDTKKSINNPDWASFDKNKTTYPSPSGSSILNTLRYIEDVDGILVKNKQKTYSYNLDSIYSTNNKPIYVIKFNKKKDKGFIHIFADTKNILKIDFEYNKYYSTALRKRVNAKISLKFNYYKSTPFLSSANSYYKKNELEHFNSIRILTQKFNEFELSKNEYWGLNMYDNNPFISYNPEVWKDYSIEDDLDYKAIKRDLLTNNISLEMQFEKSSNQWFNNAIEIEKDTDAKKLIKNLKTFF